LTTPKDKLTDISYAVVGHLVGCDAFLRGLPQPVRAHLEEVRKKRQEDMASPRLTTPKTHGTTFVP